MSFLILGHVVIAVLAFCTFQCDSCAHNFHLAFFILHYVLPMVAKPSKFRHKKKTYFHSPVDCIIADAWKSSLFLMFIFFYILLKLLLLLVLRFQPYIRQMLCRLYCSSRTDAFFLLQIS